MNTSAACPQGPLLHTSLLILTLTTSALFANAQCPAVGADTTCGIVITVIATGNAPCPAKGCAAITFTGQGPYDKIEDTLVGVVNNSNLPINSLVLKSSTVAFAFDGDGICGADPNSPTGAPFNPRPAGCPFGPTTYEGPGVSFSNMSGDRTMGTVNFNPAIPVGGSAYFSLEESLIDATGCSTVINGSVPKPASGGTGIQAVFKPNGGYTLAQAAQLCGFTDWDWQQTVTLDPCMDVFEAGSSTPLKAPPPYNDPPLKGYSYQVPPNAVSIPVYWNPFTAAGATTQPGNALLSLADHKKPAGTPTMLDFSDAPADPCLSGKADGTGKKLGFTAHLVGLVGSGPGFGVQDTGVGFSYISTFNGTNGGIAVRNTSSPVDPGSGTGGIIVTNYNDTTSYQFPKGLAVTAINGNLVTSTTTVSATLLGAGEASVAASGLAYSRFTQTFNGTVTITNVSAGILSGPFQIVLDSLTPGVVVVNSTTTFGGWPYVTVPNVATLSPGESATVTVQFKNPSNVPINFSPVPYSGGFN